MTFPPGAGDGTPLSRVSAHSRVLAVLPRGVRRTLPGPSPSRPCRGRVRPSRVTGQPLSPPCMSPDSGRSFLAPCLGDRRGATGGLSHLLRHLQFKC